MWQWIPRRSSSGSRTDADGLHRGAVPPALGRGEGQAELLVLVGGGDELVRGRVHAGGDPDQDGGDDAEGARQVGHELDLGEGVHDDPAEAVVEGAGDLGGGLVVPVQGDPGGLHAAAQGDGQLPARGGVHVEALLAQPAHHLGGQEGLAGVVDGDLGPDPRERLGEGGAELAGARPEGVLGVDVGGSAVALGELRDGDPRDGQHAVLAAAERLGPDDGVEGVEVLGDAEPGRCQGGAPGAGGRVGGHAITSSPARTRRARPGRWPGPGVRRR